MKQVQLFTKSGAIILSSALFFSTSLAFAAEVQIFSNEEKQENSNVLILDNDNSGGDVTLQFGNSLGEQLLWDNTAGQFIFTDDLNVQGNIDADGTITAGSGNIQITDATGNLDGEAIADNTIDEDSVDFGTGAGQIGADDLVMIDNFDNSNNTNVQGVTEDIDAALGNRTYTAENAVSDGESVTASIDALDQSLGGLSGTTSNGFILDNDNTGGNVTLQFGTSLNEQIYWNNATSMFVMTDDVNIQGNADIDGTIIAGSGNVVLTNATGNLNGEVIQNDTIDDDSIDFGMGVDQVGGDDIIVTDTFDNSNSTNVQGALDDIDASVGQRVYTEQNYVTSGQAVANSIDALDQQVKDNASALTGNNVKSIPISMNDLTIGSDGSNNLADVYTDFDAANSHAYYILKTQQTSLQDLDLRLKVKLPDDFVDFTSTNDLSFFFRNTGANNTDSKIDILVEDADGDDAYTASAGQNLFSSTWAEYTDEFDGASFDPAAGEYVYITVKGYTSYDSSQQNPYIGEIVLKYNSKDLWAQ